VTFDTNSGGGTATQDNASLTTGALSISGAGSGTVAGGNNTWTIGGSVTIGASGTLTMGSGTITVNGNWTRAGTFTYGTSTVVWASNGAITTSMYGSPPSNNFYNLTVNLGVTLTTGSGNIAHGVSGVLTVNGTLDLTGNTAFRVIQLRNEGSSSSPLVMGTSGLITSSETEGGGPNDTIITFGDTNSFGPIVASINIPAGTYYNFAFELLGRTGGVTYVVTGNWLTKVNPLTGNADKGVYIWAQANDPVTLDLNSRTINISGIQDIVDGTFGVIASAATVNVRASPTGYNNQAIGGGILSPMGAGFFMSFGSSIWNVTGDWMDGSTSASWSAGTGVVHFLGPGTGSTDQGGGNATIQELGGGGTKHLFGTITVAAPFAILGTDMITFVNVDVNSRFTMNSVAAQDFEMSTDSGVILLSTWAAYDASIPDIRWTFNPSISSANVIVTFGRLTSGQEVALFKDAIGLSNIVATTVVDGAGVASFSHTGGWSSHFMFVQAAIGGISDSDLILIALLLFMFALLVVLGMNANPPLSSPILILAGIVAVILTLQAYSIVGSVPLAIVTIAVAILFMALGVADLLNKEAKA